MAQVRGFLSYAHEDFEIATRLYGDLSEKGHTIWFDKNDFDSNLGVDSQVLDAIRESNYFILLLTNTSVTKEGYIRKEIKLARQVAQNYETESPYLIPVRATRCDPNPSELSGRTEFIDLFDNWPAGIDHISSAIPSKMDLDLLASNPHAVHAALCNIDYLRELAKAHKDRSGIAIALDNALTRLSEIPPEVKSKKIYSIKTWPKDFATCLEFHFTYGVGKIDPGTTCDKCGAVGKILHGTIEMGGKSPSDYNDNYVILCTNCFWSDYTFEVDYLEQGPMKYDYKINYWR